MQAPLDDGKRALYPEKAPARVDSAGFATMRAVLDPATLDGAAQRYQTNVVTGHHVRGTDVREQRDAPQTPEPRAACVGGGMLRKIRMAWRRPLLQNIPDARSSRIHADCQCCQSGVGQRRAGISGSGLLFSVCFSTSSRWRNGAPWAELCPKKRKRCGRAVAVVIRLAQAAAHSGRPGTGLAFRNAQERIDERNQPPPLSAAKRLPDPDERRVGHDRAAAHGMGPGQHRQARAAAAFAVRHHRHRRGLAGGRREAGHRRDQRRRRRDGPPHRSGGGGRRQRERRVRRRRRASCSTATRSPPSSAAIPRPRARRCCRYWRAAGPAVLPDLLRRPGAGRARALPVAGSHAVGHRRR